jgi:hypothetical protein
MTLHNNNTKIAIKSKTTNIKLPAISYLFKLDVKTGGKYDDGVCLQIQCNHHKKKIQLNADSITMRSRFCCRTRGVRVLVNLHICIYLTCVCELVNVEK